MIEVEIKIKLEENSPIKAKLAQMEADHRFNLIQIDRYYDSPKELPSFSQTDQALRIRTSKEFDTNFSHLRNQTNDITFKGPKIDDTIKTREEIVCLIDNPDQMEKILHSLHYQRVIILEKHRQVFHVVYQGKYDIECLIDSIEGLEGSYFEAEIMAKEATKKTKLRELLLEFIQELGYSEKDSIRDSYLELVLANQV